MRRPRVVFVVAHDRRGVMGRGGALPWHLPEDLKHFKRLTLEKPVVMGRKTFESIGKPLPRRRNIVLTRNTAYWPEGVEIARSVDEVFEMTAGDPQIAIIGGAEIFNEFAPYVDTAFVTEVDAEIDGETFYAAPQRKCVREVIGECAADERNAYAVTFVRCDYVANADVAGGSVNESKPSL
ncbi:MAG TPA: dihydrofolate reductase [Candidatus Baltobacteraceae bacterium]|nr:dihydrofolate reductase [Candidatus Baltobacteraceae bacterium]